MGLGKPIEWMRKTTVKACLMSHRTLNKKRIALAARKGGVGKTTICCGIASLLAARGHRTLVVDLDPQSNAAFALGADPGARGTVEALLGHPVLPQRADDNLWVYAGGPALQGHDISALDSEELRDLSDRLDYDFILFDCPPSSEALERLGVVAADLALVIVDAHPFAMMGASRVLEVISQRRIRHRPVPGSVALVQSRIDLRRSLDRDLEGAMRLAYPDINLLRVRQDSALAASTTDRIPLSRSALDSRGAKDLLTIIEWIYEKA
jgi:chromosome partitioning protein